MSHNPALSHSHTLNLGARGRLVLPAAVREQLGLREGDRLVLTVQPDGSLRLVGLRAQVTKLQGLYKNTSPGADWAGALIEERRLEARQESDA
ncbi:AbrB/MazE/SpoVT family DNA-binding domain-containing protein [Gloeobacter morelensis]|uniref:AbrB/MazE/SpoVT family DNA-binding domain-containing protein n=1 Tax=Gloeobacter morelensis MG652769 TaxID=2781736 RepID=A0ABY3PTD4_9CYAN|nr:AbrB/MazE/SpoVT family DNA-binding domain-containing protein [Gloeobacter morelensis MG652769]